ncbi:MAG: T9SS type A sorting domain-containing protein [Bacteroidota bacterium]
MKKLVLLGIIGAFSSSLYSQTDWTKHPDNPLMFAGAAGEWDAKLVAPCAVLYYDSTYHMWYQGTDIHGEDDQIGYATSPDGITWTKYSENPVLKPGPGGDWDDHTLQGCSVLKMDTIFHMWYTGHTGTILNENYRIGHATSQDGILWVRDTANNPVLEKGASGDWDDVWVINGAVIYDSTQFHMWYLGWNGNDDHVQTGHATSPDGVKWIKDPHNPVIPSENNHWDYPNAGVVSALYDGKNYKMWYNGGAHWQWNLGYATSEDGSYWEKYPKNPVFMKSSPGSWDSQFIFKSNIIDSCGVKYKMWYCGGNATGMGSIGYAELDSRIPYLTVTNKAILDQTDTLFAGIDLDGVIYIVPHGTAPIIDSITKFMLASIEALAEAETQILLTDLSIGQYSVIAVSGLGFVCTNPFFINIVENAKFPNLNIENYSVVQGDTLRVASDKDGAIYLVNTGTTPENILIQRTRIKDSLQVTAGNQAGFPTLDLYPKVYLLYAIDEYGQFSEAYQVIVNPADPIDTTGISITNAGSFRIFPNPVYDLLKLQTRAEGGSQIEISTINGQRIYTAIIEGSTLELDLSSFQKGVYFITIMSKDFVTTRKIIKL